MENKTENTTFSITPEELEAQSFHMFPRLSGYLMDDIMDNMVYYRTTPSYYYYEATVEAIFNDNFAGNGGQFVSEIDYDKRDNKILEEISNFRKEILEDYARYEETWDLNDIYERVLELKGQLVSENLKNYDETSTKTPPIELIIKDSSESFRKLYDNYLEDRKVLGGNYSEQAADAFFDYWDNARIRISNGENLSLADINKGWEEHAQSLTYKELEKRHEKNQELEKSLHEQNQMMSEIESPNELENNKFVKEFKALLQKNNKDDDLKDFNDILDHWHDLETYVKKGEMNVSDVKKGMDELKEMIGSDGPLQKALDLNVEHLENDVKEQRKLTNQKWHNKRL